MNTKIFLLFFMCLIRTSNSSELGDPGTIDMDKLKVPEEEEISLDLSKVDDKAKEIMSGTSSLEKGSGTESGSTAAVNTNPLSGGGTNSQLTGTGKPSDSLSGGGTNSQLTGTGKPFDSSLGTNPAPSTTTAALNPDIVELQKLGNSVDDILNAIQKPGKLATIGDILETNDPSNMNQIVEAVSLSPEACTVFALKKDATKFLHRIRLALGKKENEEHLAFLTSQCTDLGLENFREGGTGIALDTLLKNHPDLDLRRMSKIKVSKGIDDISKVTAVGDFYAAKAIINSKTINATPLCSLIREHRQILYSVAFVALNDDSKANHFKNVITACKPKTDHLTQTISLYYPHWISKLEKLLTVPS